MCHGANYTCIRENSDASIHTIQRRGLLKPSGAGTSLAEQAVFTLQSMSILNVETQTANR
jgi:hypothetical protein